MAKKMTKARQPGTKVKSEKPRAVNVFAPLTKPRRKMELQEYLNEVREHAMTASDAGSPSGACLVPNPQTGGNDCVYTDQETCTSKLKGTWIGGPCGPD